MKWMEFIKVQTAQPNIAAKLMNFVAECGKCHGLLETKIFDHATVNDCSICLRWDTDRPESQGSRVGLSLCNTLRKYGLVDHSIWVERIGKEEKNS